MSAPVSVFEWRRAIRGQLPATLHHVALHLSDWMDADGTSAFPSTKTLAETCGRHRTTVEKALRELVKAGWLTRERTSRRAPCHYSTAIPSGPRARSTQTASTEVDPRAEWTSDAVDSVDLVHAPSGPPPHSEWTSSTVTTSPYQHKTSTSLACAGACEDVVDRAAAAGVSLNGRHRDHIEKALERGWTAEQIVDELVPRITAAGVASPGALAVTVLRELGSPPPPPPPRVDDCPDCQGRGTIVPDDGGDPMQCAHPRLAA